MKETGLEGILEQMSQINTRDGIGEYQQYY